MATIDDLNISITQMSSSDLLALIHELRSSRRTKKNVKISSAQKKLKAPNLSLLTSEQRLQMVKELEGME